ncbi:hypothetical protein [Maribacter sp. 2308TA10-17]|uniref:hypothetical protein n=1 Tax=Maribacter sp. 2308TA10-17 TaxID=3386276 RepID=UPI0039BCDC5B
MKKTIFILLLVSGSLTFAQQSPNESKLSLNMHPFELEDFKSITNPLSEFQIKPNKGFLKPSDNMPIFEPKGKFFLEIYKVEENIDHKIKIFEFEQSKYNSRNLG